MSKKEKEDIWKYLLYIEDVLRTNKLWLQKDKKGMRTLGKVLNPDNVDLDVSDLRK